MSDYVVSLVDRVSANAKTMADSVNGLTQALKSLSNASDKADEAQKKVKSSSEKLGESFSKSVSPMKTMEGLAGRLGAALNPVSLMLTAVAVAAAASVGAVLAFGAALAKAGEQAVSLYQARRQLVATFDVFTEGAGKQALGALEGLARKLPFAKAAVVDWGKSLSQAGIQGNAMEKAVYAAASSSAILGDNTGAAGAGVVSFLEKLQRIKNALPSGMAGMARVKVDDSELRALGITIKDISRELNRSENSLKVFGARVDQVGEAVQRSLIRKGGNALSVLSQGWPAISAKMKDGFASLFRGLDDSIAPFMKEVKSLFSEFFEGSATMKVAGGISKGVLSTMFELATKATRAIHLGFLDAEIAALKFAIHMAPAVSRVRALWKAADGNEKLLTALKGIGIVAAGVGVSLAVAFAPIAIGLGLVTAAVGVAGYAIGQIPTWIDNAGKALVWLGKGAAEAASSLVQGLVNGITSGATWVVDAVTSLADQAIGALKRTLKIQSPSQITQGIGLNVARGMEVGIDRGAPGVSSSAERMGGAAVGGTASGAKGGGGRGSVVVNVAPGAFVIQVPTSAEALQVTEEKLTQVFERVALELGLMPAGAT